MEAVMAKKGAPKPEPNRVRSATTNLRSTPEWKEWAEKLAEHDRAPSLIELIDRALVAYARGVGFKDVAPKR
jgi:hypothetical protein